MAHFICKRCGMQFEESDVPPSRCPICDEERQYLGPDGQEWTTLGDLSATHKNVIRQVEPGIHGIGTEPVFAIGQRAMLITTPAGNILWDCITYVDDDTVEAVRRLGGISAIAISHPHYYSSLVEWSRRFGGVPVFLHADDSQWIMRSDPALQRWTGERREILPGATLIRVGGHFSGSTVLHWAGGAGGKGTLHTGDSIYVVADKRYVSFMRSYPNLIPLAPEAVRRISDAACAFQFETLYGAWWDSTVKSGARRAVEVSAKRYIEAVTGSRAAVTPPPPRPQPNA